MQRGKEGAFTPSIHPVGGWVVGWLDVGVGLVAHFNCLIGWSFFHCTSIYPSSSPLLLFISFVHFFFVLVSILRDHPIIHDSKNLGESGRIWANLGESLIAHDPFSFAHHVSAFFHSIRHEIVFVSAPLHCRPLDKSSGYSEILTRTSGI